MLYIVMYKSCTSTEKKSLTLNRMLQISNEYTHNSSSITLCVHDYWQLYSKGAVTFHQIMWA